MIPTAVILAIVAAAAGAGALAAPHELVPPTAPSATPRSLSSDGDAPVHIPMSRSGMPPNVRAQVVKRMVATLDEYEAQRRRRRSDGDLHDDEKRGLLPVPSTIVVASSEPVVPEPSTAVPEPLPPYTYTPESSTRPTSATPVTIVYPTGKDRTGKANDSVDVTNADLTNWARSMAYTVDVDIGSPPQTFSVLVDTGSPDLWVFSSRCKGDCVSGQQSFNSSASSTWASVNRPLDLRYLKGMATGLYGQDVVTLANQTVNGFEFGLVSSASQMGFSDTSMSGILGLSLSFPRATDPTTGRQVYHSAPFWSEVAHTWKDKQFGLFLGRDNTTLDRLTAQPIERAGQLTLGGVDETLFQGELNYVDIIPTTTYQLPSAGNNGSMPGVSGGSRGTTKRAVFWAVGMDGISVNDVPVDMGSYEMNSIAVLDSGTTAIYGPPAAVRSFYSGFGTAFYAGSNLWAFRCDEVENYRTTISFGGQAYSLEPSDLIMASAQGTGKYEGYCFGSVMQFDQADSYWLIGDAFLTNVYTAYRLDPPSVGFAQLADEVNWKYKGGFGVFSAASATAAQMVSVIGAVFAGVFAALL